MKYLDLISKFWEYNQRVPFGSSAAVIYTFLVHKWYQNQCQDFVLSDIELSKELKITVNTIKAVKEKLREHKLIQYQIKIGYPCYYNILIDYSVPDDKKIVLPKGRKNAEKIKDAAPSSNVPPAANNPTVFKADIPSFDEFLSFAKSLKNYTSDFDDKIEAKYNSWVSSGWISGYNRPITNWQSLLKSTMPYIINSDQNKEFNEIKSIPSIKPPKTKNNG